MKQSLASILVVEDDPAILNGLLDVLVFNGYDATGASDGADGLQKGLAGKFDLILLDLMLPSVDGFTICREIRTKKPDQAIIMITAKGAEEDVLNGFKAGADDYVSKPFSLRELMVRVEAVLRRSGKFIADTEVRYRGFVFEGKTLTASFGEETVELTRKEMDIIAYLHRHRDRIVSKKELLTEVWHYSVGDIETRTVDIHMLKLRKKIAALNPETQLVLTVRGEGYRLEPEE